MPYRRPPRIRGFGYLGLHAYQLTFCTFARRELFRDTAMVEASLEQLRRTSADNDFAVIAYCFMPDHVHLLVEGRSEASDLRLFMKVLKQRIAHAARPLFERPIWQEGYHDHVLRDEEPVTRVARYILENPVRARLVENAEDYPFSGSLVHTVKDLLMSLVWGPGMTVRGTCTGVGRTLRVRPGEPERLAPPGNRLAPPATSSLTDWLIRPGRS